MHAKLVKSDYHGAYMRGQSSLRKRAYMVCLEYLPVSSAKNHALVGVGGIVIHETENAVRVVNPNRDTKRTSVFRTGC
jgi:hypothetical protein